MKNIQIIFDFDSVILNSHIVKTKVFMKYLKYLEKQMQKRLKGIIYVEQEFPDTRNLPILRNIF